MISSGTTAISTSDDTPVTVFAIQNAKLITTLTIINTGAAPGFFPLMARHGDTFRQREAERSLSPPLPAAHPTRCKLSAFHPERICPAFTSMRTKRTVFFATFHPIH